MTAPSIPMLDITALLSDENDCQELSKLVANDPHAAAHSILHMKKERDAWRDNCNKIVGDMQQLFEVRLREPGDGLRALEAISDEMKSLRVENLTMRTLVEAEVAGVNPGLNALLTAFVDEARQPASRARRQEIVVAVQRIALAIAGDPGNWDETWVALKAWADCFASNMEDYFGVHTVLAESVADILINYTSTEEDGEDG